MTDDGARVPWHRRLSLRLRITLVTALVVAVAMTVGGALILLALDSQLVAAADDEARVRAEEIAVLAAAGDLPTPLPAMRDPEAFAEVVSGDEVVAATPGLDARARFGLPERAPGEVEVTAAARLPVDEPGPFRVAAYGVETPTGPATVFVAVPVTHLEHTLAVAAEIGAIGLAALVVVLAAVTWLAIGRALAPVEAVRARADLITASNLSRRVPVSPRYDEVGRLARTVNGMLGRLERSVERQHRFVADAAHELRSPIATLRLQLETTREREPGRRVDDMLLEIGRMELLVDQLLVLARADADGPWVLPEPVDLDDVVASAAGPLRGDRGVTVDTSSVEPVQLSGDPRLLQRAVDNLLSNAVRHAVRLVRVSLSAGAAGTATLVVDDDGAGVPEERREEVFERFVRLDGSRERHLGGVGLGLAIVSEIVRAHGGQVHAAESPLGGARFVVELPNVLRDQAGDPAEAPGVPSGRDTPR
jgi:signal transduction histidine kinase